MKNYFSKTPQNTISIMGFEHLTDRMYLYVSPVDGKILLRTSPKNTSHLRPISISESREIHDVDFWNALEDFKLWEVPFLYVEGDGVYVPVQI